MRGIVLIDDGAEVHVIPRAEVRYAEISSPGGDTWLLKYQLAAAPTARSVRWEGDCRPPTLKEKISIGEYNRIAAQAMQTMITRGERDLHLERRSDGVILVRSGLLEDDARAVLCRKLIAEAAYALLECVPSVETARGRLDDLLRTIYLAARNLQLPDEYPVKEPDRAAG